MDDYTKPLVIVINNVPTEQTTTIQELNDKISVFNDQIYQLQLQKEAIINQANKLKVDNNLNVEIYK